MPCLKRSGSIEVKGLPEERMHLKDLLKGVVFDYCSARHDAEIEGIARDSRSVRPGWLFVAVRGASENGHAYIPAAVSAGASCIVAEDISSVPPGVGAVHVSDSRSALTYIATNFYGAPFQGMTLIGITGTNGKTTTSYLIESILAASGHKTGVIGTVNYRYPGKIFKGANTTPDSIAIMALLREMADAGVSHVVMEVSSHALDQGRADGCPFKAAVFTNLSRDHLDYHESMDSYFFAKTRLFTNLGRFGRENAPAAVINADDPRGCELMVMLGGDKEESSSVKIISYGLGKECMVRPESYYVNMEGIRTSIRTPLGTMTIESPLIGKFNIYNILAATAASMAVDIDLNLIASGINLLKGVPGRLERVPAKAAVPILVDYAHSPDALYNILETLQPLKSGRLITVFGCGGDRDRGKRPQMGRIAAEMSEVVVITSDNPRTEDPEAIARQIEDGVVGAGMGPYGASGRGYMLELDRKSAISKAVGIAVPGDIIIIAGKGHEDYQILGNAKRHFDDREAVLEATGRLQ